MVIEGFFLRLFCGLPEPVRRSGTCRVKLELEHHIQTLRNWVKARVFKRIFDAVSDGPDMEYIMINRAISKVHRHGQGAKGDAKPVHQSLSLCWDKFKFSELPTNLKKRPF